MLERLYLNNIAVIKEETIEFSSGFNVFTGETGAGKTILINAINAILGSRMSKDIIRNGEEQAVITALFSGIDTASRSKLEELGYETDDDTILITRTMNIHGKSVCKINGRPANLQVLKELTSGLIDIHGQHDSGFLMDKDNHIVFLDTYGNLEGLISRYKEIFSEVASIKRQLTELEMDEQEKARRLDVLNFQINEITSAKLEPEELEELCAQRDLYRNSEKIAEHLKLCNAVFDGENGSSIIDLISVLSESVGVVAGYMEEIKLLAPRVENAYYELQDIASEIACAAEQIDFDPFELSRIEERISTIHLLEKKYGAGYDAINAFLEECIKERDTIELSDQKGEMLTERAEVLMPRLKELAGEITSARIRAANEFLASVQKELAFLNMPSVRLSLQHEYTKLRSNGQDCVEFLIATNEGEEAKPLSKIASGGELSRVMLSIKNVFAGIDSVGTSIFDEIDAGVSGEAAQKIGEKLASVAKDRQIICVTHLAQVAMYGDSHFMIKKETHGGRTYTHVRKLDRDARIREIARITSGNVINESAYENAESLLDYAGK